MVPALQLIPFGETNRVFEFRDDHWGIDNYDVVSQRLRSRSELTYRLVIVCVAVFRSSSRPEKHCALAAQF